MIFCPMIRLYVLSASQHQQILLHGLLRELSVVAAAVVFIMTDGVRGLMPASHSRLEVAILLQDYRHDESVDALKCLRDVSQIRLGSLHIALDTLGTLQVVLSKFTVKSEHRTKMIEPEGS